MSKREGASTADLIVEVATQLFGEKGYHAASMSQLAKRVGVEKSALYYHFPSKLALFEHILESGVAVVAPQAETIATSPYPVSERLRQFVRAQVLHTTNDIARARISVSLVPLERSNLPPEFHAALKREYDRYRRLVDGLVSEGMESGVFRSVPSELIALAIQGMADWVVRWYRADGPLSAEEIADRFADMVMQAVLPRDSAG